MFLFSFDEMEALSMTFSNDKETTKISRIRSLSRFEIKKSEPPDPQLREFLQLRTPQLT